MREFGQRMARRLLPLLAVAVVWSVPWIGGTSPVAALQCPSDCNTSLDVTVDELIRAINIALGTQEVSFCAAADTDGGGTVAVDEIVQGVNAALQGCGVAMARVATGRCISCHSGIEDTHAVSPIGCTQCHAGNPRAADKESAHVQARAPLPQNATILPEDYFDLPYLQFMNPSNLRVAATTCGQSGAAMPCHTTYVEDIKKSLMATNAGHLTGGGYQNGILPDQTAQWGNFPVTDTDGDVPTEQGALASLVQVPNETPFLSMPLTSFERNYADVPRKLCMRCHLWSRGKTLRGSPGHYGDYRSEGCAACHMLYTDAALSESGDPTVDKTEPGHPRLHQISRRIPTGQCAHCHFRGARIGLSYQGLSQLPPGTPNGPNYVGLTPEKIHGGYHLQNPAVNPPDIHYEQGMHCIDCHVRREIMGDGNIYGHMDQATEIECETCHGTPTEYGSLVTPRGLTLPNVRRVDGQFILTSKVDGKEHVVRQIKDAVDPQSPTYNAVAARSMNADHIKTDGGLECYTCHTTWQPNCYGCHFERDRSQNALDMLDGEETPGKPATGKKYFVNFKNFHMGYNAEGKVAPYITGCQALATITDESGREITHQKLPVTGAGLSGLSLNPEQTHTVRRTARQCTECHRNPSALGLGTDSFDLSRRYLFALSPAPSGELVVIERTKPSEASVVGRVALPDPRQVAVMTNQIDGSVDAVYVADGTRGLVAVRIGGTGAPEVAATVAVADPRDVAVAGHKLYVAAGSGGLISFDVTQPLAPVRLGSLATTDARAVAVHGLYVLVADGAAGLRVIDVTNPASPRTTATLDLNGDNSAPNAATDVMPLADYSDPPLAGFVKPFAMMAYVADRAAGVRVVNLDDPTAPFVAATIPTTDARALFARSQYVPGSETVPSIEKEFLFIADGAAGLRIVDISDAWAPAPVTTVDSFGAIYDLLVVNAFEPPANKVYLYAGLGQQGCAIIDVSDATAPVAVKTLPVKVSRGLDLQRVALDRMVDEDGQQIKDTSHAGARPFTHAEMDRIQHAEF